jgi:hypothetical protein
MFYFKRRKNKIELEVKMMVVGSSDDENGDKYCKKRSNLVFLSFPSLLSRACRNQEYKEFWEKE